MFHVQCFKPHIHIILGFGTLEMIFKSSWENGKGSERERKREEQGREKSKRERRARERETERDREERRIEDTPMSTVTGIN